MDLTMLERFVTIAERGGFRNAAKVLFVTQPALTKQIRRLEDELGVDLFERGRWGLRLTERGEILFDRAQRLLADVADLPNQVKGAGEVVRLGCSATATGSFLAPFLASWILDHPEIEIRLVEDGAVALRERLREHDCDVAVVAAPVPTAFDHRKIKTVAVQAVLPRGHRLAGEQGPVPVSELAGERVLLTGPSYLCTQLFRAACELAQVQSTVVAVSRSGQSLAALAEAGLGIAIMADSVDLRGFELSRRVVSASDGRPLTFELHAAWCVQTHLTPGRATLIHDIERHFAGSSR